MACTKVTPRGGQAKAQQITSRAQAQMEVAQPEEQAAEEAPAAVQIHTAAVVPYLR